MGPRRHGRKTTEEPYMGGPVGGEEVASACTRAPSRAHALAAAFSRICSLHTWLRLSYSSGTLARGFGVARSCVASNAAVLPRSFSAQFEPGYYYYGRWCGWYWEGGGDKQGTFARFARFARFFQRKGVERSPKIFFFPRQKKKKNSARPARGFGSQNGAQTLQPLQTTCGSAGVRLPYTPTPDCERDVHAGRVRGIGAIRGSRPCTRGAHVKPGAHLPSRCVGSFHSPLQKLAASPAVSRRRARSCRPTEGRAAARRPSPAAPSARTWSPGCSPKGVRPRARVPTPCGAPSATEP